MNMPDISASIPGIPLALSVDAAVWMVAFCGEVGDEAAPVNDAWSPVMRSSFAGNTRCDDMSMRPFSSVSFSV